MNGRRREVLTKLAGPTARRSSLPYQPAGCSQAALLGARQPSIVSALTMGKPDMRFHAPLTHGDLKVDGSGYLYDAAMRRAVVETGGGGSVEVFEALAALRLAAKRIHDAMERFAEGHGLSESRFRVLTRSCHRQSRHLPLGALD